jgi:HrpA-like RNA helicase
MREPEIDRVDLAGVVLGLMAAGSTPESFRWFDAPSPERVLAARELLERLGAIEGTRVTALGHQLRRLPLHPRPEPRGTRRARSGQRPARSAAQRSRRGADSRPLA